MWVDNSKKKRRKTGGLWSVEKPDIDGLRLPRCARNDRKNAHCVIIDSDPFDGLRNFPRNDRKNAHGVIAMSPDLSGKQSRFFRQPRGSAFILVVVLTALLAAIGVMFFASTRMGNIGAAAKYSEKELDYAVDMVVGEISDVLFADVPGDPNNPQEYYDYPNWENPWLASSEPYYDGEYKWRQISDVTGYLEYMFGSTAVVGVLVDPPALISPPYNNYTYIKDRQDIVEDVCDRAGFGLWADADGDGMADSKWIMLDDWVGGDRIPKSIKQGQVIFAAIRVVDNGGMVNVNTATQFAAVSQDVDSNTIDGRQVTQIDLEGALRPGDVMSIIDEGVDIGIHGQRCGGRIEKAGIYDANYVWKYADVVGGYWPFNLSDEMELRNRNCINYKPKTRIDALMGNTLFVEKGSADANVMPYSSTNGVSGEWYDRMIFSFDPGNPTDLSDLTNLPGYDRRHLLTSYNMDRVIGPDGFRQVNINDYGQSDYQTKLYRAAYNGFMDMGGTFDIDHAAKQLAANIKDKVDSDCDMTVYDSNTYGFEKPSVFLSEIGFSYYISPDDINVADSNNWNPSDPNKIIVKDPNVISYVYYLELCKRHWKNDDETMTDGFKLQIRTGGVLVKEEPLTSYGQDRSKYQVFAWSESDVPKSLVASHVNFNDSPEDGEENVDPDVVLSWSPWYSDKTDAYDVYFGTDQVLVAKANSDPNDPSFPYDEYKGGTAFGVYEPNGTGPLEKGTYYWRIDDVNSTNNTIVHKGSVWSFTVGEPRFDIRDDLDPNEIIFGDGYQLRVLREGYVVDECIVPLGFTDVDVNDVFVGEVTEPISYQREISYRKHIRQLWADPFNVSFSYNHTLGHYNAGADAFFTNVAGIQTFFGNYRTIGEIGETFNTNVYRVNWRSWYEDDGTDHLAVLKDYPFRFDVTDPNYGQVLSYMMSNSVDPGLHTADANETRVRGRVNINTAPMFVIAQLPWVSEWIDLTGSKIQDYSLAQGIVDLRDDVLGGFENISDIMLATEMGRYSYGGYSGDQQGYPDLSVSERTRYDGVADDVEERDLIFARISDLITVRSDVFTAYILVRLGVDGPQRRCVAIFDRSGVRRVGNEMLGKVKLIGLYEVPSN